MKIFIGWSGETSHQVALALRDWLPKVIQTMKPYVSSEDIAKGVRWSTTLAVELQTSSFGIICVTRENASSPWINFEAGALSKEIEKSLVVPFLFGLKTSDIEGPLTQFQGVVNEEQEIAKLLTSINDAQPEPQQLDKMVLNDSFQLRWPKLKERLDEIAHDQAHRPTPRTRDTHEVLEELLNLARTQNIDAGRFWEASFEFQKEFVRDQNGRFKELAGIVGSLARGIESLHRKLSEASTNLPAGNLEYLKRLTLDLAGSGETGSAERSANELAEPVSRLQKALINRDRSDKEKDKQK